MTTRILLIALAAGLTLPSPAFAADSPKERRVTVSGHGKASAVPDLARLSISVMEEASRVEKATQEARLKAEAVFQALRASGIPDKDIQTQAYHVAPKDEWKNGRSVRIGYVVSNQVQVTVRDLKKTGTVLAAALDAGANGVSGPEFDFSDPRALERKALGAALEDAQAKASLLARGAGASLGEALEIREGYERPEPRPMMMRGMAAMKAVDSAPEPIAAGEDSVSATVTVSFLLK